MAPRPRESAVAGADRAQQKAMPHSSRPCKRTSLEAQGSELGLTGFTDCVLVDSLGGAGSERRHELNPARTRALLFAAFFIQGSAEGSCSLAEFLYQDGFHVKRASIELPPTGRPDFHSAMIFAIAKSGSTLVNLVVEALMREVAVPVIDIPTLGFQNGFLPDHILCEVEDLFKEHGYCYLGYRSVPNFMVGLIPQMPQKKVFVLRDPRDMLVSLYFSMKYSHEIPERGTLQSMYFSRLVVKNAQMSIDEYCIYYAGLLSQEFSKCMEFAEDPRTLLLRYEDFIYDKRKLVEDVCNFLMLDVPKSRRAEIAQQFDLIPKSDRPNEHVRQAHPGDHRRKLKVETVCILNEILARSLDLFGYHRAVKNFVS